MPIVNGLEQQVFGQVAGDAISGTAAGRRGRGVAAAMRKFVEIPTMD
jgi:hypothetical protein